MNIKNRDEMLALYESQKDFLAKRNLKNNPKVYFDFTLYFFPEIVDRFDKMPNRYFKFIDEIMDRKILLEKVFKERKSKKEIVQELNISNATYYNKLKSIKESIKEMYVCYAKTGILKKVEKHK